MLIAERGLRQMAKVTEKLELLRELREHPDRYLPIINHAWKVFPERDDGTEWYDDPEYNLGWDVGLLPGNRPYFLECWATCGITMLTYFVSVVGIEDAKDADLIQMLEDEGLFQILDPSDPRTEVQKYDVDGNKFFSINVVVGDEDNTYVRGGKMFPFPYLNEFNTKKGSPTE
jgi:hypothetical protein